MKVTIREKEGIKVHIFGWDNRNGDNVGRAFGGGAAFVDAVRSFMLLEVCGMVEVGCVLSGFWKLYGDQG